MCESFGFLWHVSILQGQLTLLMQRDICLFLSFFFLTILVLFYLICCFLGSLKCSACGPETCCECPVNHHFMSRTQFGSMAAAHLGMGEDNLW